MVTKEMIGNQLLAYLQHHLSLADLTNWAENTLQNGQYIDDDQHITRNVLAYLGLADVKAFGLEWQDCESMMEKLGFKLEVRALRVA